MEWHIISGEYPPQPGGVSDYTRNLALELAATDEVHVWAPPSNAESGRDSGPVHVHRLSGCFDSQSLRQLSLGLSQVPEPRRLLVQYVPQAFGYKGMNLLFTRWLARQSKTMPVWTMFHEVAVASRASLKLRVLSRVTGWMARKVFASSERVFVSIPGWIDRLGGLGCKGAIEWLPIPSNVPSVPDARRVEELRQRWCVDPAMQVLGHFGTYGPKIADVLFPILEEVLGRLPQVLVILAGRNSPAAAEALREKIPAAAGRIVAVGGLPAEDIASHCAACDLMIQPFPDGISSRRTSVMASLAAGVPVVSHVDFLSEKIWVSSGGVALAASGSPRDYVERIRPLLEDPSARQALGTAGRELYERHFSLANTVAHLRGPVRRYESTQE